MITEIFKLLSLVGWWLCLGFSIIWFGVWCFAGIIEFMNVPPMSLLFKPNKNYGKSDCYTTSKTISHSVYNDNGYKVGTIETEGPSETHWITDDDKYKPRYFWVILYLFFFPINRIFAVILSFIALFTNKFYVASSLPKEILEDSKLAVKYNRTLYTLFNVVYERTTEQQKEKIKEIKERQKLHEKREKIRKERKQKREENKDKITFFTILFIVATIVIFIILIS